MEPTQLREYVPVLLLALLAGLFTGGMLAGSALLGARGRRTPAKDTAWECGMKPEGAPPGRFSIHFRLVAMLFILFDIAVVFLYPWAVAYRSLLAEPATRHLAFFGMGAFLGVLGVGYFYALKKKAFDWRS